MAVSDDYKGRGAIGCMTSQRITALGPLLFLASSATLMDSLHFPLCFTCHISHSLRLTSKRHAVFVSDLLASEYFFLPKTLTLLCKIVNQHLINNIASAIKTFIEEKGHSRTPSVMKCPAQNPDLNIVKAAWHHFDRE